MGCAQTFPTLKPGNLEGCLDLACLYMSHIREGHTDIYISEGDILILTSPLRVISEKGESHINISL